MEIVGQEVITAKRDLSEIFPAEIANRKLINQYIQYILNNYFEKSKEKMIAAYIGTVVESIDGTETYVKEPTVERQLNQIIPVLNDGTNKITFSNYMADLHNEGCTIYDQNKLLSSRFWSWCPPINADAFTNFVNYYWIGYPYEENNILIFNREIDVIEDIIGKESYTYQDFDDEGYVIYSHDLADGDIVVFPNDISLTYNHCLYRVDGVEAKSIRLRPTTVPLIIIAKNTNVASDIIGQKNYTFDDDDRDMHFSMLNGMRIRFLNDENTEYNNRSFMVIGVGDEIDLIEDSYNPYSSIDVESLQKEAIFDRDYFVMERGSIDGNDWSRMNRWVQRRAIEVMNIGSMESIAADGPLHHASKPILIFNKDIELYNSGTFSRGEVKYALNMKSGDINGTSIYNWEGSKYSFNQGDNILLLKNVGTSANQLYTVKVIDEIVYLEILKNGQTEDGASVTGDSVKVLKGDSANKIYYYNGDNWVIGQTKLTVNQKPLFNLYDVDKVLLDNPVNYPNSTFEGCTLFQYQQPEDKVINDEEVDMPIVVDTKDATNFYFESTLVTDTYYFTPENDYQKEISGYRLYRNLRNDSYLNNWHSSSITSTQYLKTRFEILTSDDLEEDGLYKIELKYTPSKTTDRRPLIVTVNDIEVPDNEIIYDEEKDNVFYLKDIKVGDVIVVKLLTDDIEDSLDEDYVFEYPLSLTVNQFNKDVGVIAYNDCFNQMISIINGQPELNGSPIGSNNYSSIVPDVSIGTKIIQSSDSVIRSMILNNNSYTSIRGSILYAMNAYAKFKLKFSNLVTQEINNSNIIESELSYAEAEANHSSMDEEIAKIIKKINIGKEGLMPFYNNGVMTLLENAYIPATPAYLGAANCYEPRIETWTGYTLSDKPRVVVGHDGSLTKATGSIKDLYLLRFEELIYQSIENKFKDTRCGINIYKSLPGKFRKETYSRQEYLNVYSPLFESWCNDNNYTYTENDKFKYDDLTVEPDCWKTWNYTGMEDKDGEPLYGSYRAVYTYYYDTYRPDTHPWEMLGFGDEPSWWKSEYGNAPYTSQNIVMWKDIENGIIKQGPWAGEYHELKRPGLFENYLPVDENGQLLDPVSAGIMNILPPIQLARKKWVIGDIGDLEFAYQQLSESKFAKESVYYMLRPVEWIETNWNTLDRETLFKGTSYEQILDSSTNAREDISKMVMHNELIDEKYVRKIGIQQWISDFLAYEKISITDIADEIRNADVCLGYRCAGYYQYGSIDIVTDTYGSLPSDNIHVDAFDSKHENVYTYSGMTITKTKKGYVIDGFDISYPYFKIKVPDKSGKKSTMTINDKVFYYYHNWKKTPVKVSYRTEFETPQEVYDVIIGYGKYLEEVENWYFTTLAPNGTVLNFRTSGESFCNWATSLNGKDPEDALILINPGSVGIGNNNSGTVSNIKEKVSGFASVRDIYGAPVEYEKIDVYRQAFNTYFEPKDTTQIALIKFKTYDLEHLITFDNETIYGDTLYNSLYSAQLERFKLYGVKVLNWYGTLYAPGYIVRNNGAIPNYDKTVNDLQYIYDVDDVHCQGDYATYSKGIVGYRTNKTYKDLYLNEKSMFDFYKGMIRHKGTKKVVEKMNRSSNVSSTGNNIELFEQWAFREGQYGHIKDNSVDEFILDSSKMIQNPQVITFETAVDYYYDKNKTYNYGDICVYSNYEYIALFDKISGKFDPEKWKKLRYVGNYIIFETDPKWIKKSNSLEVNCFKYTDNLLVNPIGGFARTDECSYVVATQEEADNLLPSMEIGETVWVVKNDKEDWNVLKKTGVNKFVSMRYFNIADAVRQPNEEFVYHFKDDRLDYYTPKNSENIEIADIVYDDIDDNNKVCKWGDIGVPEYTGKTGQYITGTDYKVKLYNTVFTTMVPENLLNNGTPFKNIYIEENESPVSISYSNLLLNMTQFGTKTYKYKFVFSLKVDTYAPDVKITINGTTYENPTNNTVELIVCEEDVIDWTVTAHCCGTRSGQVIVQRVGIDGVTNTEQPLKLEVPLSYRENSIIYQAVSARDEEPIVIPEGIYDISFVGAGGGAGGGYVRKKKHGHLKRSTHHYYPGSGGASGAYLHGIMTVSEEDKTDGNNGYKYSIVTGKGGNGGKAGHNGANSHGACGGNSALLRNRNVIIYAQSGAGGYGGGYGSGSKTGGRVCGTPGVLQDMETLSLYHCTEENDSKNGRNGYVNNPGSSVYPIGKYGAGGTATYKGNGNPGVDGFGKVIFKTCTGYKEYSDEDITRIYVEYINREIASTDSFEYSSYYQPYVIRYDNNNIVYFYSYDLLHADNMRPSANIVSSSSAFYRNRSKAITAYHKSDIIKNLWVDGSNVEYKVGDTVSVKTPQQDKYTYYICEFPNVSTGAFTTTTTIGSETVVLWREYSPTYYYKITYNNGPYDMWQKSVRYELDDVIRHENEYYKCIKAHDAFSSWDKEYESGDEHEYWEGTQPPIQQVDEWVASTHYEVGTCVQNEYEAYKCVKAHDALSTWSTTSGGNELWEQILFPTDPMYQVEDGVYYELYEDANCTKRAEMNSKPFYMDVSNLDLSRPYVVGEKYTLVDQFATYRQLKPTYMKEPSWSGINQLATYPVASGGIQYYLNSDLISIENDSESLVYSDELCTNNVKSVKVSKKKDTGSDDEQLEYTNVSMKYVHLTNTEEAHKEISYELQDKDTLMYTSKASNELTDDTEVYQEFELENLMGIYQDYIPVWEKTSVLPNAYENTFHYIKYSEIDDNTSALEYKNHETIITDGINELDLCFKDTDGYYKQFCCPAECNADKKIVRDIRLYRLADYIVDMYSCSSVDTVETYEDLLDYDTTELANRSNIKVLEDETHDGYTTYYKYIVISEEEHDWEYIGSTLLDITDAAEESICRVNDDERVGCKNVYYQYVESQWQCLGLFSSFNRSDIILGKDERVYLGDIYVESLETNKSILYADKEYTKQSFDYGDTIVDNNTNANIPLYFNKQSVGSHITTGNIIQSTENIEEVRILAAYLPDDAMYKALYYMVDRYNFYIGAVSPDVIYDNYISTKTTYFYLDKNETLKAFDKMPTVLGVKQFNYTERFKPHSCQVFNLFRNENGNITYTKLFLYGDKFYSKVNVLDKAMNETIQSGILYGDLSSICSYTKIDNEYSPKKTYVVGDVCVYNDKNYECVVDVPYNPRTLYAWKNVNNISEYVYTKTVDPIEEGLKVYNADGEEIETDHLFHITSDIFTLVEYIELENGSREVYAIYTRESFRDIITRDIDNPFDETHWIEYSRDKIVNVITYKDFNDLIYITSDNMINRVVDNVCAVSDPYNHSQDSGSYNAEGKNGWLKLRFINEDYQFELEEVERKRLAVENVKSCYLVDNSDDSTMVQVQVFDPIQNILPNNILNEINYISSRDPVNDYNNQGKWSDNKVGFLWWDTSKVRYVDYYQGDYEYRRANWGKQLPGSEIVINEWTKSYSKPEDGINYVEKTSYNPDTSTVETYYYYWNKNPIAIPEATFRTTSAYHIAELINDPTGQGVIWMSPIDSNVSNRNDNTLVVANFSNVMTGQETVLQLNTDSDKDIMNHTEWVMIEEETNDNIPDWLWEKMSDSLLGYKNINGVNMPVPAEDLEGRQRLGIAFRPRQTMFGDRIAATENFVDAINDIFANRTAEEISIDLASGLEENVDNPVEGTYDDEAGTMLELMSWKDPSLIGEKILVRHDETHDNMWVIYEIGRDFKYFAVDYQKYNIKKYINYVDWYANDSIKYLTPVYTEKGSETIAKKIALGEEMIPGAKRYIRDGEIVKYSYEDGWKLYQYNKEKDDAYIVAQAKSVMELDKMIYDYVNEGINNTDTYLEIYTKNEEEKMVLEKSLTKYQYIDQEIGNIIKILLDYLDVNDEVK